MFDVQGEKLDVSAILMKIYPKVPNFLTIILTSKLFSVATSANAQLAL